MFELFIIYFYKLNLPHDTEFHLFANIIFPQISYTERNFILLGEKLKTFCYKLTLFFVYVRKSSLKVFCPIEETLKIF